ncbi:MAG: Rieske (2Fe-2S) protein [Candidatus Bathyarchaeota archaeon]|nr:Rieske (2Fe-2S) protein [Candidatus Bathyarchaeota archaeon]
MAEDDFVEAIGEGELKEGSMKLVNVAGRGILLVRHGAEVYGVSNRCPHMGCSLANGKLKEYIVTCPCHGWSFDVRSGEYQKAKQIKLLTYECKIQDGKIYVKIPDDI